MRVVRDLESLDPFHGGYASIGNFDGVHQGHQAIVRMLVDRAQKDGVPAIAVTFDPHPMALLRPEGAPSPLTTLDYRTELLQRYGVDATVILQTNRELLSLTAREFFDSIVLGKLRAKGLVEGPNFFFGKNRSGNITMLKALCHDHGLAFDVAPPVTVDEQLVSSSVIRSLIEEGDIEHAVRLLGHPFRLTGIVGHGEERGRTIGFPTANLEQITTLIPAPGVYAGKVIVDGMIKSAAVHIGPNPTFGETVLKVEAHILDFAKDLYGSKLSIDFHDSIRDVRRFGSLEELKRQLETDIKQVRQLELHG